MRLSESITKKILIPAVGGVLYRFKGKTRRDVFFFEDITAEYVKVCQDSGYSNHLRKIGYEWMSRVIQQRIPNQLKNLPKITFINFVMGPIWANLGLMDSIYATKHGEIIKIETKGEGVTRIIGKNELSIGLYIGILNTLYKRKIECIEKYQSKEYCRYKFKITNKKFTINSKKIEEYDKLNELLKISGLSLGQALNEGIFQLKRNNRIYFREKPVGPIENTVFHLFGIYNLLFDRVPQISYNFFNEILGKEVSTEKKLVLLKTLLQAMGWGITTFTIKSDTEISMEIRNPPYGLQPEKDNWNFLINVILGYLWTINKKFKIDSIEEEYKRLVVDYRTTR